LFPIDLPLACKAGMLNSVVSSLTSDATGHKRLPDDEKQSKRETAAPI
jgi:hypothetical protein